MGLKISHVKMGAESRAVGSDTDFAAKTRL